MAPTATYNAPLSVNEGSTFALSLTSPSDPSSVDTTFGFTYAFDCGAGFGLFGAANTASCTTAPGFSGPLTVQGKIKDKDSGETLYSATVTVVGSNAVKSTIRASLASLLPTGDKKNDERIQKAIKNIDQSLAPDLWNGPSRLTKKGQKVFEEEKKAVSELMKITSPTPAISNAILGLVAVDRALAQTAISDAIALPGNASDIAKAQAALADGDAKALAGEFDKAIEAYKKAWQFAWKASGLPSLEVSAAQEIDGGQAENLVPRIFLPLTMSGQ